MASTDLYYLGLGLVSISNTMHLNEDGPLAKISEYHRPFLQDNYDRFVKKLGKDKVQSENAEHALVIVICPSLIDQTTLTKNTNNLRKVSFNTPEDGDNSCWIMHGVLRFVLGQVHYTCKKTSSEPGEVLWSVRFFKDELLTLPNIGPVLALTLTLPVFKHSATTKNIPLAPATLLPPVCLAIARGGDPNDVHTALERANAAKPNTPLSALLKRHAHVLKFIGELYESGLLDGPHIEPADLLATQSASYGFIEHLFKGSQALLAYLVSPMSAPTGLTEPVQLLSWLDADISKQISSSLEPVARAVITASEQAFVACLKSNFSTFMAPVTQASYWTCFRSIVHYQFSINKHDWMESIATETLTVIQAKLDALVSRSGVPYPLLGGRMIVPCPSFMVSFFDLMVTLNYTTTLVSSFFTTTVFNERSRRGDAPSVSDTEYLRDVLHHACGQGEHEDYASTTVLHLPCPSDNILYQTHVCWLFDKIITQVLSAAPADIIPHRVAIDRIEATFSIKQISTDPSHAMLVDQLKGCVDDWVRHIRQAACKILNRSRVVTTDLSTRMVPYPPASFWKATFFRDDVGVLIATGLRTCPIDWVSDIKNRKDIFGRIIRNILIETDIRSPMRAPLAKISPGLVTLRDNLIATISQTPGFSQYDPPIPFPYNLNQLVAADQPSVAANQPSVAANQPSLPLHFSPAPTNAPTTSQPSTPLSLPDMTAEPDALSALFPESNPIVASFLDSMFLPFDPIQLNAFNEANELTYDFIDSSTMFNFQ